MRNQELWARPKPRQPRDTHLEPRPAPCRSAAGSRGWSDNLNKLAPSQQGRHSHPPAPQTIPPDAGTKPAAQTTFKPGGGQSAKSNGQARPCPASQFLSLRRSKNPLGPHTHLPDPRAERVRVCPALAARCPQSPPGHGCSPPVPTPQPLLTERLPELLAEADVGELQHLAPFLALALPVSAATCRGHKFGAMRDERGVSCCRSSHPVSIRGASLGRAWWFHHLLGSEQSWMLQLRVFKMGKRRRREPQVTPCLGTCA